MTKTALLIICTLYLFIGIVCGYTLHVGLDQKEINTQAHKMYEDHLNQSRYNYINYYNISVCENNTKMEK